MRGLALVSRIETGRQPYTQDYLEALASVLQTDLVSLLTRDPLGGGKASSGEKGPSFRLSKGITVYKRSHRLNQFSCRNLQAMAGIPAQ